MTELRIKIKKILTELEYSHDYLFTDDDIPMILDKIEQAINNTGCSLELKEIKKDNFEEWVLANRYELYINGYKKGLQHFSEIQVINKYTDYLQSL